MARIRTVKQPSSVLVVIDGPLRAGDMRRLEHACGPALTTRHAPLVVDIQGVTEIDGVAQAHLNRIANRGAVIRRM